MFPDVFADFHQGLKERPDAQFSGDQIGSPAQYEYKEHDVAAHHRSTFVSRAYSCRGVYLHIAMANDW